MKLLSLRIIALTILSSLTVFLAVPNELFIYGNWILGLICLTPLFVALILAPDRGIAGYLGLLFGVLTTVLSYYWLAFFQDFSIWTITGTSLGYALYFLVFFPFIKRFTAASPAYRPIILAAAWTVFEYFKTAGYLGFPWGLMAYPFSPLLPFIQIADITGVWGISFVVVLFQAVLAETIVALFKLRTGRGYLLKKRNRFSAVYPLREEYSFPRLYFVSRKKQTGGKSDRGDIPADLPRWNWHQWTAIAALTVLLFGYGGYRLGTDIPVTARIQAVMVQQNIDSWLSGNEIESLRIGQRLTREALAADEDPVDLIMWSETSFRRPFDEYYDFYLQNPPGDPFTDFLDEVGTYMFVGSPQRSPRPIGGLMNSVILLHPERGIIELYGKQHPVPFAEHVPFWEVPAVRRFFQNSVGLYSAGWTLGKEYTIFSLPLHSGESVTFGAPICFEDAFPYINRRFILEGADLLINLTNDSWSRQDSAQTQHFLAAYFRSIETRRVMVRSTNAGVSGIIDAHGRVSAVMPFFEEAALRCTIPVQKESRYSFYVRFGDYLPYLLMVFLFGVLLRLYVRDVRARVTL